MSAEHETLGAALEQAVASVRPVWEGEGGRILIGDFSQSKIVGYTVGAKEWERLVLVCRETGASNV